MKKKHVYLLTTLVALALSFVIAVFTFGTEVTGLYSGVITFNEENAQRTVREIKLNNKTFLSGIGYDNFLLTRPNVGDEATVACVGASPVLLKGIATPLECQLSVYLVRELWLFMAWLALTLMWTLSGSGPQCAKESEQ